MMTIHNFLEDLLITRSTANKTYLYQKGYYEHWV